MLFRPLDVKYNATLRSKIPWKPTLKQFYAKGKQHLKLKKEAKLSIKVDYEFSSI